MGCCDYELLANSWGFLPALTNGMASKSTSHVCVSDVTKKVNVVYHFAPMGGASREQEYPAKALEIIVLTLTMAN